MCCGAFASFKINAAIVAPSAAVIVDPSAKAPPTPAPAHALIPVAIFVAEPPAPTLLSAINSKTVPDRFVEVGAPAELAVDIVA